uniref:Ribonuclease H-like domain-containing protein n=1 Tax=Tanacetum cinerariifolium TaxID=118510 RepID=A0A6L2LVY2_TANCI|nr:ribonuclease H-like domain-containing protein [Tanacetum cinerariifolium]
MSKPLTPHHEPSQENNYPNQALPNHYIIDTLTSPQVVSHPPFPISPINSHVTHTQAPPKSDNQTQHTSPLSPSRESLVDDINQLQDLPNLVAMHLSQQQNNIPSSPYSPNLPHTLNIYQVETHVGYLVPTGRVIVPTGRYVVPTGRVIVATSSMKRTGRDHDGSVIILPPTTTEEHIAVQRESKARTTLLQSIPDEHQEFSEFRIGKVEGLHKGYDRMQKILSQLNQLKTKPDAEDINLKFLRALPSSWSQIALTLKTKGGLEFLSFDDLSYKLKTLEIEKLDLEEMDLKWKMAMLSIRVHKFEQKAGRKINFDKKESARFNKKKVRCYKCQQRGHFARECRAKGGNDKQRYSSFKIKEIGKKEEDSKALITVDTLVDLTDHDGESDGVIAAKEFGMMAGYDSEDAIKEGVAKLYNLITGANSEEANTTGRPVFHMFTKTDSMKVIPSPLSGYYTSLSDHIDLDESQMSYGTKSSTSCDSKSVSNNFVSCNDSDKSSEVNTNDFASSDSSVKSSEHQPNDSTSCVSTSSVFKSVNEAEIESNDLFFMVHDGGLVLLKYSTWTKWPSLDDTMFILVVQVFPLVLPVFLLAVLFLLVVHFLLVMYALTHDLILFDSLVKQFWSTATLRALELGPPAILATTDKTPYTITEDLDQFGSPIAIALICLSDGRRFNWSNYIFRGMVVVFSSKLSANMRLNFVGHPMPLLPAMLLLAQAGEGAEVAAQAVPYPVPAPDQPPASLSKHSRQQTSDPTASVLEHEDAPMGGDFHTSPPRSFQAPPASQPSGGAEDPITLTALSSVVSTLVHKVHSLESELKDHKKLFKDVVGKLVKKVKALEVKLKSKKRKLVVSDSDQEDCGTQGMDLDSLRALANAAVNVASNIPSGGTSQIPAASPSVSTAVPPVTSDVPPGTSNVPPGTFAVPIAASTAPAGSPNVPTDVPSGATPAGVSSKGKSPMVEEYIPVKARTFKQMEEDRLGEEAAKRLDDEEMAHMERERAETLLGDDVSKDNFPARMAALIKKKRQALAEQLFKERQNRPMTPAQQKAYMRQYVKNQSSAIYNTGWTMAYVKSFTDDQLKQEFEKIRKVQSNSQIQAFSRILKRPSPVLEEPSSKRQQSTEAPIPSVPEVLHSHVVSLPPSSRTRRKSLGRKHIHKPKSTLPKLDLDADAQTFIKVVVNEDSDDENSDTEVWSVVVGWEVLPTPLGEINVLYRIDGSTKHFATLRGKGSCVWQHQNKWEIRSWRLYTLSDVHVLETVSGEVLSMFTDVSYPLSVKLMERMLMHKLEIDSYVVANDMTTAEQLIQFIKNQLAAAQASFV